MQTLEREQAAVLEGGGSDAGGGGRRPGSTQIGTLLRWTVAALMLGAAGIHFGMMGEHAGISWTHGMFFAIVAWLEIGVAAGLVFRPSRWMIGASIVLNLSVLAIWVLTRTVGVAIGGDGTPEAWGTIDGISAAFEGVAVILSVVLLNRYVARKSLSRGVGLGSVALVAIAVAVLTSLAFSPAIAEDRGSGGSGNGHGGHGTPGAAGGQSHGAVVPGGGGLVKTAAGTIITGALTGKTPCELSGKPASVGQVAKDAEGHDHRGPLLQVPLTRAEAFALSAEQMQARSVALKYPTVADAEKAGYGKSTPYVPCIGAHYTNARLAVRPFDPGAPSELLYDGTTPDAKIIGLSFLVYHPGGAPEGFTGPNDVWHTHSFNGGLCMKGGLVIGAEGTTPEQCAAIGGRKVALKDIWMVHDWIVPGFDCSWGVFAGECPEMGGRVGGTAWDAPAPGSVGALGAKKPSG